MTGLYWDFFFFFFKSGTWLYVALSFSVLAGSDFGLLGQERWEFDAAVSLREREITAKKGSSKNKKKKNNEGKSKTWTECPDEARFKVKNQIHAQFHPIRKEKNGHDKFPQCLFLIIFDFKKKKQTLMGFSFAHCAVWTLFFCLQWRQESWPGCIFVLPVSLWWTKSQSGNMASSSASGCCFASAVAYLL